MRAIIQGKRTLFSTSQQSNYINIYELALQISYFFFQMMASPVINVLYRHLISVISGTLDTCQYF